MTVSGIPETTHQELLDALVTFDAEYRESAKWAGWQDRGQFKYAISHDDRLYPVKMIIELATGMDRRVIYGGTQANGYVKHYGFTVVQLRDLSSPWDAFIHWAKRFEGKYEGERSYKVRIATNLRQAREALLSNSEVWPALLRKSFGAPADLTPWQANSRFLTWCDSDPQAAKLALGALWSDTKPFTVGFRACVDAVPGNVFSDGYELPIVSFLLMAEDEAMYPVFRAEPFAAGSGSPAILRLLIVGSKAERAIARYEHGLGFLDELREQAQRRGLALRDRLDARSALQAVTKWQPGADDGWSEADRQAFLAYQKGGVPASCTPEDGIAALAQRLLLDESYLARIQQMLHAKRQVIFYGPPGTGKTYVARELARFCAVDGGRLEVVQFHPSYAYEDFVEGYRPKTGENQSGFELVPGPLRRLAADAQEIPDGTYILLVDEINRGNIAKVFGELYYLLEYRDEEISLQYSRARFGLPGNLWIIGTMNSADRSIALIDGALRRRFFFVPFFPDKPPIEGLLWRWLQRHKPDYLWLAGVVDLANSRLENKNAQIGPSYFMTPRLSQEWLEIIWEHSILPYLEEQFFGEEEKLKEFDLAVLRKLAGSVPANQTGAVASGDQAEGATNQSEGASGTTAAG